MDLPELLRSQAKRYRCAACGENMAECGIEVIAQQGNRALVRVKCSFCKDENLLQIIFQTEGDFTEAEDIPAGPPVRDTGIPENLAPISGDELLDLHSLLEEHSTGLTDLFKATSKE